MIRLQRLRVRDIGRLADVTVELDGQLVGIVGPNGVGKSTVLECVHFAVTGDATRLGRQDAICKDAPDPRPTVDLEFVPGCGVKGVAVLSRTLPVGKRPGTRGLAWDGESCASDAGIAAKIHEWSGVPPKVLSDFVFVEQGHLADVVTAQPARRAEVLQRLFGVARAAAGHAAAARAAALLPAPPDQAALAAVRARAATTLADLRRARADLGLLETQLVAVGPAGPDDALIAARERRSAASAALAKAAADEAAAAAHLTTLEAQAAAAAAAVESADVVAAAESLLADWDAHRRWQAKVDELLTRAAACRARLTRPARPTPPPVEPPPLLVELRGQASALAVLAESSAGCPCPVCAAPLGPEFTPEASRAKLTELRRLEASQAALAASRAAAVRAAEDDARERDEAERQIQEIARLTSALTGNPTIPPTIGEDELRQTLSLHRDAQARLGMLQPQIQGAKARLAAVRAYLAALGGVPPEVDEDAYLAATRRRVDRRRIELDLSAARARVTALDDTSKSDEATLDRLEAANAAASRLTAWRGRLEKLQEVLHRDAAPATAATACLMDLENDINRRLGHLNASFRLKVSPSGELTVEYRDGTKTRKLSPERLSWAERSVLALGWRIAVQDRYAPGVGLLCLDEPTHGLDGHRLDAFRSALEAWRPHGAARQFVVVTHDRRLLGVFDRVVDLGG